MRRRALGIAVVMTLALTLAVTAQPAAAQPTFSKTFEPSTIGPGSVSTLRFLINNPSGTPARDLAFTDSLPAGMTIASPANAQSTCFGGSLDAPAGGSTISLSGAGVAGSSSCSITVDVTSSTVGTSTNTSGDLTSDAGNSGAATADLVVATNRPGFSKSFSPSAVSFGGRSTLTFTIDNSANPAQALNLNFIDNLPVGMTVASPANASSDCADGLFTGGTLTAVPGSSVISLTTAGGLDAPAVGANSTCTVRVDVIGANVGVLDNMTGELTSTSGGPSVSSGKASASLTVNIERIAMTKEFLGDPVGPGNTVDLQFTIRNLDRRSSATDISFTDDLDATLSGLTAVGLPLANPCGSGSTLSGTSLLTLSGGNLGAEGSCTFSVTVEVPAGAAAGSFLNTTSTISATIGGQAVTGNPATDTLFVNAVPVLTKTFLESSVGVGDTVSAEFTITNTSPTLAATDLAFFDNLDEFISGVLVTSLPAAGFCGAGSTLSLIQISGQQNLVLAGGNLAASGSCTFSVDFQIPLGTAGGTYVNTTGDLTATLGGESVISSPASAELAIVSGPVLLKQFTDDPVAAGDTVTLEFTLSVSEEAVAGATDIAFTDDLTATLAGLTATGLPESDICGSGSELSGTTSLSFTGGSLAVGESCTFSVTLEVPATAIPGTYPNSTSNVMATAGGVTVTSNPGQDDLQIAGLTFTKAFLDDPVIAGDTVSLEFTIENTSTIAVSGLIFTDNLSGVLAGMAAVAPLPTEPCGAGSAITGTTFLIFTGGSLAPASSCTFAVTVQVPASAASGLFVNATSDLIATVDGSPVNFGPATAALNVTNEILGLQKAFTDDPASPGGTVTLEFTLTNQIAKSASGIAFTDDLSAVASGLVSLSGTQNDICGAGSSLSGTSVLTFTGGSLAPDDSCTFSATLQVPSDIPLGSLLTNTTSQVTGTIAGLPVSGAPASDLLEIEALSFSKAFDGPGFPGGSAVLTFNIRNLSSTETATDLAFSDDLDAVLPGLVATGLPASDVCGAGSSLTGTSFLLLSDGNLLPGGSCTFSVTVSIPASASPGDFLNTTSDLRQGSNSAVDPATATLTVEEAPDLPPTVATPVISPEPSDEGSAAVASATFTDPAGAGDAPFTCTVDYGDGAGPVAGTVVDFTCTGPPHVYGDNGTFPVTVTVTDRNDNTGSASGPHQVLNVAPMVAVPVLVPEPSDEGSAATASATFSDPGFDDSPFTCTVDYGDGSGAVAGTVIGSTCTGASHVYADNGIFTVTVVVTDKDGGSGSASASHQVENVAPTVAAPVVAPEPSDEGSAVSASATFSDPGTEDAPFTCTVDYGDGTGPVVGTVDGTTCTGPSHTYADNGSFTVLVAVSDKDGGSGSASALHQVDNVSPTITATSNSAVDCGATPEDGLVEVSVDFTDPGFDSAVAGTFEDFTDSTIDWGDGTVESLVIDEIPGGVGTPTTGTASGSHVYATGGIFTITVTVADDDGGTDTATLTALVTGVGLNDGVLQVVGTPDRDEVKIKAKGNKIEVRTKLGVIGGSDDDDDGGGSSAVRFPKADVTVIEVVTCGDRDKIDVNKNVTVPSVLDGGAGDDNIKAGNGMSTLFGGPGKDKLTGGDADDVLDGGPGRDDLKGRGGADILLGGEGDDKLSGDQGPDALDGGPGTDQCKGGGGANTLVNCESGDGDDDDDDDGDDDDGGDDDGGGDDD